MTAPAQGGRLLRGRRPDEIRRYDLFKLAVALLLLVNWLWVCRGVVAPPPGGPSGTPLAATVAPATIGLDAPPASRLHADPPARLGVPGHPDRRAEVHAVRP